MKRTHRIAILAASALGLSLPGAALAKPAEDAVAARCAALSKVRLANTTIESAMLVPAKADETTLAGDVPGYPAFCRVVARVRSEPGSDIGVELWLPAQGWAGVFHGNGSGGFAGNFRTPLEPTSPPPTFGSGPPTQVARAVEGRREGAR